MNGKSLVIYFSRADENYSVGYVNKGNTEVVAEYIQEIIGADLFKVERKVPYAKDYQTCLKETKKEKDLNERPELKKYLDNIDSYDIIYIGVPIYWCTMPQPMFTQLERLNWFGKKIRIFTTHEGNGLGNVVNDVSNVCAGATILPNSLSIFGHEVYQAKEIVRNWLQG